MSEFSPIYVNNPSGIAIPVTADAQGRLIVSDQIGDLAIGVDDGTTAASTHGIMIGGLTGGGHFQRFVADSSSGGMVVLDIPQALQIEQSATVVAAAAGSATLPAAAGRNTFIRGFCISSVSATAEVNGVVTITGLSNTMSFEYVIPTTRGGLLVMDFGKDGLKSSAFNTAIVLNFPAIVGGSATALATWGYQY